MGKEISNHLKKLYDYLCNQFNDRVDFIIDNTNEKIIGVLNGSDVNIEVTSDNKGMFLYTTSGDFSFLEQFIPSLEIYRNGDGPMVKYETYDIIKDKVVDKTIEWNEEKEERFFDITSNRCTDYPHFKKGITPMFESKAMKDERLGFTSFSPCYFPNGMLDPFDEFVSMVNEYNEQDSYLVLSTLCSFNSQVMNRTWRGCWPDSALVDDAIDVLLNKISFLINSDCDSIDTFLESDEYTSWCDKWNNYFDYDKRCQYMEAKLAGNDVSSFVPEGVVSLKRNNK